MKSHLSLFAIFASLLFIAACAGPRTLSYPGPQNPAFDYYVIKVDSLEMTGSGPTTRFIALGTIGNNGCHNLAYVDTTHYENQMQFTFWGSKPKDDKMMCTQAIVPLRHELVFPRAGKNTVVINQPDGTRLVRAF